VEAFEFGGDDGCAGRRVAEQDVVETGPGWVFGHANTGGGIALWVRVDDENPEIVGGQSGSEVDGGGGLPYPALLVDDRKDSAQAVILAWLEFHVKQGVIGSDRLKRRRRSGRLDFIEIRALVGLGRPNGRRDSREDRRTVAA